MFNFAYSLLRAIVLPVTYFWKNTWSFLMVWVILYSSIKSFVVCNCRFFHTFEKNILVTVKNWWSLTYGQVYILRNLKRVSTKVEIFKKENILEKMYQLCSASQHLWVVSSNLVHGEVYLIQHYVIKFVSDLRQISGFLRELPFPPPINWPPRYSWNIVESVIKHHIPYNLNQHLGLCSFPMLSLRNI